MKATTISELLSENAQRDGDGRAFTILGDGWNETDVLTHGRLDEEARAIAARLQRSLRRGDRALVLAVDNAHFVRAFMACQYAGVIAVPVAPPIPLTNPRRAATLRAIARDCGATAVLTGTSTALREPVAAFAPELAALEWIDVDTVAASEAAAYRAPRVGAPDVSFLQYTSGSTSTPKGVMVSHRALLSNEEMFAAIMGNTPADVIVSWLPLFHDMGLIGKVLQASYLGTHCVLMPPLAFAQQPTRWLRAITAYGGTMSGAPNFAFDMCVDRVPEEERATFDLSGWRVAFSGAEPIRPATFEAFAKAYAPCGFDPGALHTAYGLAEVTLIASGGVRGKVPRTVDVDPEELRHGRLRRGGHHTVISVGRPRLHREIVIVDPDTRLPRDEDTVGEIWLAGDDVPLGYWQRPEETEETYGARLAPDGAGPYLRTGDLGVVHEGELYIVGRLKDLVIVAGRNHYPQDLEETAESAHPWLRSGFTAAFTVERGGRERVVLAAEIRAPHDAARGQQPPTLDAIRHRVRAALTAQHGLQPDEVLLLAPASLPKTSSGKIQRRACRAAYENGELTPASPPAAAAAPEARA